jgi:hypothetical protein
VPHDVVEPKTGSKKKIVMQLDRDVQVCGIFVCFSNYSFLSDSPLAFILEGVMLHSFFLCSLIGAHFFLCFLSIYFFSMTLSPFARTQEEKSLWNFGVFIFGRWMACFA